MQSSVYWIHHPEHTDMFTQGYIGVSKDLKRRLRAHRASPSNLHMKNAITKYGWDNLIKESVVVASKAYCLDVEIKLRPTDGIGWNAVLGGGNPPSTLGKKFIRTDEYKAQMSASKIGHRHTKEVEELVTKNLLIHGIPTRFTKGQTPYNKGMACSEKTKEAIRKANTGKRRTQEQKDKRAELMIGYVVTKETRAKMSKARTGFKYRIVVCPYCNKSGGAAIMPRYHFDNCKKKDKIQ